MNARQKQVFDSLFSLTCLMEFAGERLFNCDMSTAEIPADEDAIIDAREAITEALKKTSAALTAIEAARSKIENLEVK